MNNTQKRINQLDSQRRRDPNINALDAQIIMNEFLNKYQ